VGGGGPADDVIALPLTGIGSVLCIGAHCDDIEIGCGGTLLRLLESNPALRVHWVVFSSDDERAAEARAAAAAVLDGAEEARVEIETFRGSYFPYVATEIKERFDRLAGEVEPDLVLTHYGQDLHQDHRLLSELTYNTFRDHLVLEYEIPKWDGDLGRPNVFVPLEHAHCDRKVSILLEAFASQRDKHWFSEETFRAVMRIRGVESKSASGYAEAFHCRKLVVG
jgi:LmbE family N-acetylglucosaminyl deacetylase